MDKSPAFQFYPSDFLTGTADMSAEEVGVYIRLLCYQWEHDGLPKDIKRLCVITKGSEEVTNYVVSHKFRLDEDGKLRNRRLEKTRMKQKNFSAQQKLKINNRWSKTQKKVDSDTNSIPNSYQTDTNSIPNEYQSDTKIKLPLVLPFKKTEDRSMKNKDISFESAENFSLDRPPDQSRLDEYLAWLDDISEGRDQVFEQLLMKDRIEKPTQAEVLKYQQILIEYPNKKPPTQQYLRKAFLSHLINSRNGNGNRNGQNKKNGTHQGTSQAVDFGSGRKPFGKLIE